MGEKMKESFNYKESLISFVHENVDWLIENEKLENRTIVFYGITEAHNVAIKYLKEHNFDVYAIIDNNPARKNLAINGVEVLPPKEVLFPYNSKFAILIGGNYYDEMLKQLQNWGYIDNINIFRIFNPVEAINNIVDPNFLIINSTEEKDIQLNALKYLKAKCIEAGIEYYLAYGTLIGAVRHNGFIPWDNDIDVYMYERDMLKLYDVINQNDEYELLLPGITKDYIQLTPLLINKKTVTYRVDFPFVCQTGVGIDIMTMVNLGNVKEEAALFINDSYSQEKLFKQRLLKSDSFEECLPELKECLNYSRKKEQESSKYVGVMYGQTYGLKNIYKSEWFIQKDEKFENETFTVPGGYDSLLSQIYGNYMKLPPESERNAQNHPWKNYWKMIE